MTDFVTYQLCSIAGHAQQSPVSSTVLEPLQWQRLRETVQAIPVKTSFRLGFPAIPTDLQVSN